ncbi:MAG TPA: hypothetical protein VGL89_15580 [Candidatus Koribacter sp.]|jgi:uncharacterized membrane protein
MNRQKMIIVATVALALGLVWLVSYSNGTAGFNVANPVAGSKFSVSLITTGWPALGGMALTVVGVLLLLASAVTSIVDLAIARRG